MFELIPTSGRNHLTMTSEQAQIFAIKALLSAIIAASSKETLGKILEQLQAAKENITVPDAHQRVDTFLTNIEMQQWLDEVTDTISPSTRPGPAKDIHDRE